MSRPPEPKGTADLLTGVARGGGMAFGGTSFAAVMGFVLTLVVTRGLSTDRAGQFFTATALYLVLQTVLAFGAGAGLVRFIPRLDTLGRRDDVPAMLVLAVVPVVIAGLLGGAVVVALAPQLADLLVSTADPGSATATFRTVGLFLPIGVIEIVAVECTRGFGRIGAYVVTQQLALPFLRPVLVLAAIASDAPVAVVVAAWAFPLLVALGMSAAVIRDQFSVWFGGWRVWPTTSLPLRPLSSEYWSFTAVRGLASVIDIALTWLDVLVVAAVVSSSEAAIYAAASRFVTTGMLVMSALRLAIAPQLSSALARDDREGASVMYGTATAWVVLTSWPLYIVMGVFAPTILSIFGASYSAGGPALSVLCAAMLVMVLAGNVGTVLLMGGKSTWVLMDKCVVLVVNVVGMALLVPSHGILGAAMAWAIAIVVDAALSYGQVRWGMGIRAQPWPIAVAGLLSLAIVGTITVGARIAFGSSWTVLLVSLGLSGVLFGAAAWRFRTTLQLPLLFKALRPTTS